MIANAPRFVDVDIALPASAQAALRETACAYLDWLADDLLQLHRMTAIQRYALHTEARLSPDDAIATALWVDPLFRLYLTEVSWNAEEALKAGNA